MYDPSLDPFLVLDLSDAVDTEFESDLVPFCDGGAGETGGSPVLPIRLRGAGVESLAMELAWAFGVGVGLSSPGVGLGLPDMKKQNSYQ